MFLKITKKGSWLWQIIEVKLHEWTCSTYTVMMIHPSYFLCGINFYFNSTTTGGGLNWSNIEIACIRDPRVKCTVTSSCHKTALTWQRLVDRKDNQLRTWHLCLVDRVICRLISRKLCFQYTVSYIACCLHTNLIY